MRCHSIKHVFTIRSNRTCIFFTPSESYYCTQIESYYCTLIESYYCTLIESYYCTPLILNMKTGSVSLGSTYSITYGWSGWRSGIFHLLPPLGLRFTSLLGHDVGWVSVPTWLHRFPGNKLWSRVFIPNVKTNKTYFLSVFSPLGSWPVQCKRHWTLLVITPTNCCHCW